MWNDPELLKLFKERKPLIDVRAPVEFLEGMIPHSVNLPILEDEERKLVGTCYKQYGQATAVGLGHQLISGAVKEERIKRWSDFIKNAPDAEVFCFRGGLRSQITCQWLSEQGFNKRPISGGYKRLRRFFLSWLEQAPEAEFIRIGGLTGSGKTRLLGRINSHLDLEKHAHHRGSAFGLIRTQPSQVSFENLIALDLLHHFGRKIVVEDESIMLGKLTVPKRIFLGMRKAPLILLEVSQEERLHILFEDYVQGSTADFFIQGLDKIRKKLGESRYASLRSEIERAFARSMTLDSHEGWIRELLKEYYDPLYQKGLKYNQEKIIFQGNQNDILAFLGQS